MSITERTLKQWRKEALTDLPEGREKGIISLNISAVIELNKRILRMTQELLDLHLIRRE